MKKIQFKSQKAEALRWKFFAWMMEKHPNLFKTVDGKLPIETLPF